MNKILSVWPLPLELPGHELRTMDDLRAVCKIEMGLWLSPESLAMGHARDLETGQGPTKSP